MWEPTLDDSWGCAPCLLLCLLFWPLVFSTLLDLMPVGEVSSYRLFGRLPCSCVVHFVSVGCFSDRACTISQHEASVGVCNVHVCA